jgi:DNA polymerase III delta prime subunit
MQEFFVDKYRPTYKDIYLSDEVKSFIENTIKGGKSFPNLCFYGPPGGGKTSLAKIISSELMDAETLYINCSQERTIDVVEGKILSFIQTKAFNGKRKAVILDEIDGMSNNNGSNVSAQKALRNPFEEYMNHVAFIITCNDISKVHDALISRTTQFYIQPKEEDILKCVGKVVKREGIIIEDDQKPLVRKMIKDYSPDIRKILNVLQQSSLTGKFVYNKNAIDDSTVLIVEELFKMVIQKQSIRDIRNYVGENALTFNRDYHVILKGLFESYYAEMIKSSGSVDNSVKMLIVSDGMYQHNQVIDKEINLIATIMRLIED